MTIPSRPFLVLYVVWNPDFKMGATIAEELRKHFRRELYENITGGTGLSVIFCSPVSADAPFQIDLESGETSAIVTLVDENCCNDDKWIQQIRNLANRTDGAGFGARLFPVAINSDALKVLAIEEQALRWFKWDGTDTEKTYRLIRELAYELCRMLRHYLEHLKHPLDSETELGRYLKKVQIFLSHSKHDAHGEGIAIAIRDRLIKGHGLGNFFDVYDIPAGLRFNRVLIEQVRVSAMVAIHTDSYSSREWCRREVIEAKRASVPLVVASCLTILIH